MILTLNIFTKSLLNFFWKKVFFQGIFEILRKWSIFLKYLNKCNVKKYLEVQFTTRLHAFVVAYVLNTLSSRDTYYFFKKKFNQKAPAIGILRFLVDPWSQIPEFSSLRSWKTGLYVIERSEINVLYPKYSHNAAVSLASCSTHEYMILVEFEHRSSISWDFMSFLARFGRYFNRWVLGKSGRKVDIECSNHLESARNEI